MDMFEGRSQGFVFGAVFTSIFLAVLGGMAAVTSLLPKTYAGTAVIRNNDEGDLLLNSEMESSGMDTYDPYFIQTAYEVMESQTVLSNVIKRLDLSVRWSKKYYGGRMLSQGETMDLIKKRLDLRPVHGTNLITITAYSEDRQEAADVANTVAGCYRDYRLELRRELAVGGLKWLEDQLRESDAAIEREGAVQPGTKQERRLARMRDYRKSLAEKAGKFKQDVASRPNPVDIITRATPGNRPVRPNWRLGLMLGVLGGISLGLAGGIMAAKER